jgi:hypothetical protein
VLSEHPPFADLGVATRNRIIHQQTLTVEFEPEQALATLPRLLPADVDRGRAIETCEFVLGDAQDMNEETRMMFDNIRAVLGQDAQSAPAKPQAAPRAKALVQPKP